MIAGLLTTGMVAAQQYGYGKAYAQEAYEGVRAHVGLALPGDLDGTVVYGADYIRQDLLGTVNYFSSDMSDEDGQAKAQVWSFEGSYLLRAEDDPGMYYGAGLGWVFADWDGPGAGSGNESSLIWNLVVGKEFYREGAFGEPGAFVEARYNLGTDLGEADVDGLRLVGGWRF